MNNVPWNTELPEKYEAPEHTSDLKRRDSKRSYDYEEAILASGFGKFNVYVILIAISTGLLCVSESRLMAYIVPAAQCDLHLNIQEKALLNAIPLVGMVLTSFMWGFVGDIMGRKKLIVCMCFVDFSFMLMAAFSQSFVFLLIARLLGGMTSSGIYPALSSYLAEIHIAKHRAVMQLFIGSIYGLGDFLLPLLALVTLTTNTNIEICEKLIIHPWNMYLCICSLPAFISGIGFLFLPESPKFLMSQCHHKKAITVFQSIYTINTNNIKEEYPIKYLKNENSAVTQDQERYCHVLNQLSSFCTSKYLITISLTILTQFFIMMGLNSVLLWLPHILQEMGNHQRSHNNTASVCEALYDLHEKMNEPNDICKEDLNENKKIYIFCMIIASTSILVFIITGTIVNSLGKKKLLYILGIFTSIASLLLIYAKDFLMTVTLFSVICSSGNIGFNALISIVVDLFPTRLRAMSVSLTMMIGRLGGALGCFVFPVFLKYGCGPSFVFISYFTLVWVFLVYLLPTS